MVSLYSPVPDYQAAINRWKSRVIHPIITYSRIPLNAFQIAFQIENVYFSFKLHCHFIPDFSYKIIMLFYLKYFKQLKGVYPFVILSGVVPT